MAVADNQTVLVTGASGFIGQALVPSLLDGGWRVRSAVRAKAAAEPLPAAASAAVVGDVGPKTDWTAALEGVDVVVHLAARAHVLKESAADPLSEFRRVNSAGTHRLVKAARTSGVKRFVFVSSVGVHGRLNEVGAFTEVDGYAPADPYAVSKVEAEEALLSQSGGRGRMEAVIVRPPLVYGPGVKGNFLRLLRIVGSGIPLPLGRVQNRRSYVHLENLVDFLVLATWHPAAANEAFLVSDDEDLSTPELVRRLAAAFPRRARLVPVPTTLLRLASAISRRERLFDSLCGTLTVDISKARGLLEWRPLTPVTEGLKTTVAWYREPPAP